MLLSRFAVHSDLILAQQLLYEPCGLQCANVALEAEGKEYGACTFELGDRKVVFRASKITPTKNGQFVTLWKRNGQGPIMPFDADDDFDFFVVSVRNGENLGQFVFPQDALLQHDVVSKNGGGGKRAMRVYSPWDVPESLQAQKTQTWQSRYFVGICPVAMAAKCKIIVE